jgi:glycosyltransferase involved in cell wall biosynthesis
MTTTPLISVLMPAYNAAATIAAAIRSVLAQTLGDLELVIQDDGSTDGTAAVIAELAAEDRRIVALPSFAANQGLVAARNRLLEHARGDYIAFMDADDLSLPDRLRRQATFLREHPAFAAVGTAIRDVDAALRPLGERRFPPEPERQARDPDLCCGTLMVRAVAARRAGRFRPLFRLGGEDGDWVLRLADHGLITNTDEVLYVYRRHDSTSSRHAGAIRRLGVLARHAARLRREGRPDPLDEAAGPEDVGALSDAYFLGHPELSLEQRLTALSLPLAGQQPLIAVLLSAARAGIPAADLVERWAHQGFRNYELLLDATPGTPAADRPGLCVTAAGPWQGLTWRRIAAAPFLAWHDGAAVPRGDLLEASLRLLLGAEIAAPGSAPIVVATGHGSSLEVRAAQRGGASLAEASAFLVRRSVAVEGALQLDRGWHWRPAPRAAAPAAARAATDPEAAARHALALLLKRGLEGTALGAAHAAALQRAAGQGTQRRAAPEGPAAAAPRIVTHRRSEVVVRCHDDWGDLDDALGLLTPGGSGIWGRVAFERETAFPPDWHVVFNGPGGRPVDLLASPNRVVFAIGEPPTPAHRKLHEGQGEGTIVLTTDEDLAAAAAPARRYVLAPAHTRTWSVRRSYAVLRTSRVEDKPRRLSWVTSDIALLAGHRDRLAFLARLRGAIDLDLYGRGFRPIADKWEALAPYRYSVAFENTRATWYFTEKLMDCFVAETMPLYVGSPAIERFFPPEAMVILDPADPDVLRRVRDVIESDLWQRSREAVREAKRLVLERYNVFASLADRLSRSAEPPLPPRPMRLLPAMPDFAAR